MLNKIIGGVTKIFKNPIKYTIKGKEYTEEKLIGEGGFGYVYIVIDPSTQEKLALKRMNIQSKEMLDNIKREIDLWKIINDNENIVKLIDYEILDKSVNILMELCSDGTLLEYINKSINPISEKQILYIINEIANALYHMHSQSTPIAHRDIKIENVLRFGKKLKLCDFGSCSTQFLDPALVDKNTKLQQFSIFEKNTTFMYRPPEMCDQSCNHKVNEKVDIWMLGCIFYTLIYKRHPFFDAQRLTIINAQYFTPDNNYKEKLMDFMRLLLTPNPDKRPDIRKVIDIIKNWDNINKIELSKEVLDIKAKQIDNNKKSCGDLLTEDEIKRIQQKIRQDQDKKKKKNPYKNDNDDNTDINEIFGDFEENHETKIKSNNIKTQVNNSNNIVSGKSNKTIPQSVFDPFNNNQSQNNNNNFSEFNWMIDLNNNNNSKQTPIKENSNNLLEFDFVESNSNSNIKGNSTTKFNNNTTNFNDIHDIFSNQGSNQITTSDNSSHTAFNFHQNQQPVIDFNDFNFNLQTSNQISSSKEDLKQTGSKTKTNINEINANKINLFDSSNTNNKLNVDSKKDTAINRGKSPAESKVINNKKDQDIYDFFK